MVTKSDYTTRELQACRRVLLELHSALGEFRHLMVVVGGFVPYFLCPESASPHLGTNDVDLALDFQNIPEETYDRFLEALRKMGYEQDQDQPFRLYRTVSVDSGDPVRIEVDLLAGEYGGRGSHRTQSFQDAQPRKARGVDLIFEREDVFQVQFEDEHPEGGKDRVSIKICGPVSFFVMKGMALASRTTPKFKDAYDLYFVLENYPEGFDALVQGFRDFGDHGLLREGLQNIREKFGSVEHIGPKMVVDFLEIEDEEERERIKRDAFARINRLLDALEIAPYEEE